MAGCNHGSSKLAIRKHVNRFISEKFVAFFYQKMNNFGHHWWSKHIILSRSYQYDLSKVLTNVGRIKYEDIMTRLTS